MKLDSGETLDADLLVVATGNDAPATPHPFDDSITAHPAYIGEPLRGEALANISPTSDVLIVGSALTAADVTASLIADGHTGQIDSLSRTGLLPARKAETLSVDSEVAWDRITRRDTLFVERHGELDRISQVVKALRADIKAARADGLPWQGPFDELRDSLRAVWPRLSDTEQRRYLRHLRRWYDSHRFRLPPQLERILDAAKDRQQLHYLAGRIQDVEVEGKGLRVSMRDRAGAELLGRTYAAVINCTGPSGQPLQSSSPFINALVNNGLARAPAKFSAEQVAQLIALACEPPGDSALPVSHWTPSELAREAVKRGLVESISVRQFDRFLAQRTCDRTRVNTGSHRGTNVNSPSNTKPMLKRSAKSIAKPQSSPGKAPTS